MRAQILIPALSVALFAVPSAAQRAISQITFTEEAHQDAQISPNGAFVAYEGPGKISLVPFGGGFEADLVTGSPGDFVWAPNSAGLYYLVGADLRYVGIGGGTVPLTTLSGSRHRLWCVDSTESQLWGTRWDQTTGFYSIFVVGTNGAGATDIVTTQFVVDQVRIDPTDSKIVYRKTDGLPFSPHEFLSADAADGNNGVSLTGVGIAGLPEGADWVDNGQSIVFSMISQTSFAWNIARVGPTGTAVQMLTEGSSPRRTSSIAPGRDWVVMQAAHASGVVPAVMPPDGGGIVFLEPDAGDSYTFFGPPTANATGTRVAFAATSTADPGGLPKVYAVSLDRELRIHPRADLGTTFQIDMPVSNSEAGIVYMSGGGPIAPITTLGWIYGIALGAPRVVLFAGSGTAGLVQVPVTVPNEPLISGVDVHFQGIRASATGLEFTRWAEVRIF